MFEISDNPIRYHVSDVRDVGHVWCDSGLLILSLTVTLSTGSKQVTALVSSKAALFSNLNLYPISVTHPL